MSLFLYIVAIITLVQRWMLSCVHGIWSSLLHSSPPQDPSLAGPPQSLCEFTVLKKQAVQQQILQPSILHNPQGYKMCLRVDTNGYGSGEGTHVSVFTCLVGGNMMNSYSGHSKVMSSFNSSNGGKTIDTKIILLASIDSRIVECVLM